MNYEDTYSGMYDESRGAIQRLRAQIAALEAENAQLKRERADLRAAMATMVTYQQYAELDEAHTKAARERDAAWSKNKKLHKRIDALEENNWPFEWIVATEERERRKKAEAENAQLKTQNNVLFADLTNERQDHAIAEMYLAQLKQDAEVEKQSQQEKYSALVRWCDHWEWRARRVIKIARQARMERDDAKEASAILRDLLNQAHAERDNARQWAAAWGNVARSYRLAYNAKCAYHRVDVNPALPQEEA